MPRVHVILALGQRTSLGTKSTLGEWIITNSSVNGWYFGSLWKSSHSWNPCKKNYGLPNPKKVANIPNKIDLMFSKRFSHVRD